MDKLDFVTLSLENVEPPGLQLEVLRPLRLRDELQQPDGIPQGVAPLLTHQICQLVHCFLVPRTSEVKFSKKKIKILIAMRQVPLERDINIALNGCSVFATSTQKGPFMVMLISHPRGTFLIESQRLGTTWY